MKFLDLTGRRFGRLIVAERMSRINRGTRWDCLCDCGKHITVYAHNLASGCTSSCGCLQREARAARATHGQYRNNSVSPEIKAWEKMRERCLNPKDISYKNYGGRGITVCKRWLSFDNFLSDMGKRPSPKHSLDRINNDGIYEPSNCRWATRTEQNRNRRKPTRKHGCR